MGYCIFLGAARVYEARVGDELKKIGEAEGKDEMSNG